MKIKNKKLYKSWAEGWSVMWRFLAFTVMLKLISFPLQVLGEGGGIQRFIESLPRVPCFLASALLIFILFLLVPFLFYSAGVLSGQLIHPAFRLKKYDIAIGDFLRKKRAERSERTQNRLPR